MHLLSLVPAVYLQKKCSESARISRALLLSKVEQIMFANGDYAIYLHHALPMTKHFYIHFISPKDFSFKPETIRKNKKKE